MFKKTKFAFFILSALICLIFIGYAVLHTLNAPERTIITLFDLEFPLDGQKFTLTGESDNFIVTCKRYDGIIFFLRTGKQKLLQEISLQVVYKGNINELGNGKDVSFVVDNYDNRLSSSGIINSKMLYIECASSGYSELDENQKSKMPLYGQELSISITMDGKTEKINLLYDIQ